ncbi:hypothetical protein, partial [Chryseobacterium salviniae]
PPPPPPPPPKNSKIASAESGIKLLKKFRHPVIYLLKILIITNYLMLYFSDLKLNFFNPC